MTLPPNPTDSGEVTTGVVLTDSQAREILSIELLKWQDRCLAAEKELARLRESSPPATPTFDKLRAISASRGEPR